MPRYKMLNGVRVPLSQEEEAAANARDAEWQAELARRAANNYKKERAQEYPGLGDQFDRIFKFLSANRDVLSALGFDMLEVDSYISEIQSIKNKHPKPEK